MPDRYEQKRDELIKGGMSYKEAQKAKDPAPEKTAKKETPAKVNKA